MVVRRSPHLVSYWHGGRLVLHNYRTNVAVAATPITLAVLDACARWSGVAAIARRFPEYSPASVATAIRRLAAATLLESSPRARRDRADPWTPWDPAAGLLHFSSKDLPYREPETTKAILKRRAVADPMPRIAKRYRGAASIALPRPRTDGEFARVLLERRTWRQFATAPVTLDALATLLALSCGIRYWVPVKGIGRFALKTYPSGGAQQPLEVYVLARRVRGVAPGLYHYAADAHRLERVKRGATARQIARYLPTQGWYGRAAALFLITAVVPRTQWKYRFPRAYKVVIAEAGHLCQNMCLAATWLRLAPFCTMALADSAIERDLGIDGVHEAVVYAAGVGVRPPGIDWAPSPTRRTTKRTPGPLARY
ncbi:MAG TPA: SagB/ThcOx family dehydrogenase [Vicinamibacterales bacterium]|nr:SagB/ThcOx family dehydrogenase [Vicinamibacterales bacterium]